MTDFISLMRDFAERKRLRQRVQLEFRDDANRPRLYCDEPAIVARFWSQLRQETTGQLLIRGQTNNHPRMVPGLFRSAASPADQLLAAESSFADAVVEAFPENGRFHRAHLPALLQHYGFKTSWLDVVDNLWTAVWFATHSVSERQGAVRASPNKKSGWLYFLQPAANQSIDLRRAHQALSLRPHVQAGWSMRGTQESSEDLDQYVIATVEFPFDDRWTLSGYLGSVGFFFPSAELDNTLTRLYKRDIDRIAERIEVEHNLPGALGRVFPRHRGAV